jgi:hypothetical protein
MGRETDCKSCGSVRGKDVKFYLPENAPEVTEASQLKDAKSGPDWNCSHCGTNNRSYKDSCDQCGSGNGVVVPKAKEVQADAVQIKEKSTADWRQFAPVGMLVAAGIAVCIFFAIAFSSYEVGATLTAKNWAHTIHTENYVTVRESDWDIPVGGRYVSEDTRIRSYVSVLSHYETRTRQVSERVQTGSRTVISGHRDLGNGYFEDIEHEEPIYETEYHTETYEDPFYVDKPVYDTMYTYDIDKWVDGIDIRSSGDDENTSWPNFVPTSVSRESGRSTDYILQFVQDDKEQIAYRCHTRDDWLRHKTGNKVLLVRNRMGMVYEVK